jgi:hypothetical protein
MLRARRVSGKTAWRYWGVFVAGGWSSALGLRDTVVQRRRWTDAELQGLCMSPGQQVPREAVRTRA